MQELNPKLPKLSRRTALRMLAVVGASGALGAWYWPQSRRVQRVQRTRVLMGTVAHLTVCGADAEQAAAAADATLDAMSALEAVLSRHQPDSELSRLNATGRIDSPHPALPTVLGCAARVSAWGAGAFDVTILPVLEARRAALNVGRSTPADATLAEALARVDYRAVHVAGTSVEFARPGMSVTLDGIAKGYIIDQGVAELQRRGFANVYVEAGGDLMAAGGKSPTTPWRIGIRHPRQLGLLAAVDVRSRAVATSGDYMQADTADYREHHIVDPRTGRSAPDLASATVLAPDAMTADALATLAMTLGAQRARALLEDLPDCEGYFVSKKLEVVQTSGFIAA